jgi:hypothetical protein
VNGFNEHTAPKDPAHEDINSYGLACSVSRERAVDPKELRRFAAELMTAISESCLKCGAKDIGHIKAYIEHDKGFLHADTLGDPSDVTVEGRDGDPASSFKLAVNSVIYGIAQETVREATEESLNNVLSKFGFVSKPEAR